MIPRGATVHPSGGYCLSRRLQILLSRNHRTNARISVVSFARRSTNSRLWRRCSPPPSNPPSISKPHEIAQTSRATSAAQEQVKEEAIETVSVSEVEIIS